MTPYIGAPALAFLFLLVLIALGLGVASRLARAQPPALLLAPALGLGLGTTVLTTLSSLSPLAIAGPIALVLGMAFSLAATDWRTIPNLRRVPFSLFTAVGITVLAIGLALVPVLAHGTYGPVNLYFMDSWFFVAADEYLTRGTLNGQPVGSPSTDPTFATVAAIQRAHSRLGVDALQASLFELTRTRTIAGQYPVQAAYIAVVGLTTYGIARLATDLRRVPSAAAAVLAITLPITVELWVDPRPANLVAVILGPVLLLFGARSVLTGGRADAYVAGIALGGIVVCYVEHLPTLTLAAIVLAFVGFIVPVVGRSQYVRRMGATVGLACAIAFVLSPPGWLRAFQYAKTLEAGVGGPPLPGLDAAAIGVLLAGTAHVYELSRIPLTAPLRAAVLLNITACALLLCGLGILQSRRGPAVVAAAVYGSILVVSGALAAYFRLFGNCGDYCVQKALTLSSPAVAVTVVLGIVSCWRLLPPRSTLWRLLAATVIVAYVGFIGRASIGLLRGAAAVPMAVDQRDFAISEEIARLPKRSPVLVEGAESVGDIAVFFDIPAALELARSREHPLRYDKSLGGALAGGTFAGDPFREDYRYVLSRFPGLRRDDRRTLKVFGQYALQQRTSTTDVALVASGGTRDPYVKGSDAVPWLRGPLTLRLVGVDAGIAVRVTAVGSAADSITWSASGARVRSRVTRGQTLICASVLPGPPVRDVVLIPEGLSLPQPAREPTQRFQRPPRAVGITSIDTDRGPLTGC